MTLGSLDAGFTTLHSSKGVCMHYTYNAFNMILNFTTSFLRGLVPAFNDCVDSFLEELKPQANGKTPVAMKLEFKRLTINVISKVPNS